MLKKYAIIDGINVVNLVEYENDPGDHPPGYPDDFIVVQSDEAGPGWEYINGQFVAPPQPELTPPPELTPAEKLAAAGLTVDDLKNLLGLK